MGKAGQDSEVMGQMMGMGKVHVECGSCGCESHFKEGTPDLDKESDIGRRERKGAQLP